MLQKGCSTVASSAEVAVANQARCVALTQEHRGHGVSTAAYYLARALVDQGLHVLLGDFSQRPSTIAALANTDPVKNLVPWTPPLVLPSELSRLLAGARKRTAGLADVLLLDADIHLLEGAKGMPPEVDYVVVLAENTPEGHSGAERLAHRLSGERTGRSAVGVVFSRVDAPPAGELPHQLESGVPILGWLPADYLLAAGEAYSLKGRPPSRPHEAYLNALGRIAQALIRVVPLQQRQAGTPVSLGG